MELLGGLIIIELTIFLLPISKTMSLLFLSLFAS